jgi:hypothetical protein
MKMYIHLLRRYGRRTRFSRSGFISSKPPYVTKAVGCLQSHARGDPLVMHVRETDITCVRVKVDVFR